MMRFPQRSAETRSQCLGHYARLDMRERGLSFEEYSDLVLDAFDARQQPLDDDELVNDGGRVKWSRDRDQERRRKANGQMLRRYMGLQRAAPMPADLEEAVVDVLSAALNARCLADLCRRYGLLPVPIPCDSDAPDLVGIGRMSTKFGETLQRLAPIMADGKVNAADLPHLDSALDGVDQLIAACLAVKAQLQATQQMALEHVP